MGPRLQATGLHKVESDRNGRFGAFGRDGSGHPPCGTQLMPLPFAFRVLQSFTTERREGQVLVVAVIRPAKANVSLQPMD